MLKPRVVTMTSYTLDDELYWEVVDSLGCAWRWGQTSRADKNGHIAAMVAWRATMALLPTS